MEFGPYDLLMDFALMSILLFIAQVLRSKIRFIQNLYLPSSLIAGFLGLFLGKQFLNVLPFSDHLASYPYMLIVVLFASLFIGNKVKLTFKKIINEVGDTFTLNMAAEVGQFGFAIVVGSVLLLYFFPEVNHSFSLMLPAGFCGGHGYAAAIGGTLKEIAGWDQAQTIGQTFATIGILFGIFTGLIFINLATRTRTTKFVKTMSELPESMRTGMVPKEEQKIMGNITINPMSLDPMTWHFLLILIAAAGGYYAYYAWKDIVPGGINPPMMCLAMLAGVLLNFILNRLNLNQFVDKRIITRMGSSFTDYLVAFGIASISITVVMEYIWPLIIMLVIGALYVIFYTMVICRKLFHNFWFERSIFIFGWTTGVVAMGVTLLRIVDPEFKSKTLEDYGMAYIFISIFEIMIVSLVPIFVAKGFGIITGLILLCIWLALLAVTAYKYGLQPWSASRLRKGEAEVLGQILREKDHARQTKEQLEV